MAIIQISKIQQRSGNIVDLPQLDEAEFGWATDSKRLFIGKTTPNENIEVLTSYSHISFSQIDGASGNLDIDAVSLSDGEVLAYNGINWTNRGGDAGGLLSLGNVANVKINGGGIGYVLETDGTGNLSWTPKSVLTSYIQNVTKASPAVVTTTEDNFFIEGAVVTITNVPGMTELNGRSFYANILTSNTFALYSDSTFTTPINSSGYTTFPYTTVSGTSVSGNLVTVGNTALFSTDEAIVFVGDTSTSGIIAGQTYYVRTKPSGVTMTISETVGGAAVALTTTSLSCHVYASGGRIISEVTGGGTSPAAGSNTAVQFNFNNILSGSADLTFDFNSSPRVLTVNGNANVGNVNATNQFVSAEVLNPPLVIRSTARVANLNVSYSNVSDFEVVTAQTTGTFYPTFVNGSATANRALGANANLSFNAATGALSATLLTGTLTTAAQPNITSVGTLTSLAVTGNISGANLTGTHYGAGTGLTAIPGGNVSGQVANSLVAGTVYTAAQPNITSVGTLTALTVTGNTASGNVNADNLLTANYVQGVLTTAAQPNITSVGTLSSLGVTGTTTSGNFATAGNITASFLVSNVATGTAPLTVTSTTQVSNLNVARAGIGDTHNVALQTTGTYYLEFVNATSGNLAGAANATFTANIANGAITATTFVGTLSGAATTAGTVTTAAQPNITSTGTLTGLGVNGTVTAVNITANTGVFTGNGSGLSALAGANVTGTVANATYAVSAGSATTAGTVTTAAQPNITSHGTLTSLNTGNVFVTQADLSGSGKVAFTSNASMGGGGAGITFGSPVALTGAEYARLSKIKAGDSVVISGAIGDATSLNTTYLVSGVGLTPSTIVSLIVTPDVITKGGGTANVASINVTALRSTISTSSTAITGLFDVVNTTSLTTGANTTAGTITGTWTLTAGSQLNATYADLAEFYSADAMYEAGTVLEFGGDEEVTLAEDASTRVAGVISTDPAYAMNANCSSEYPVAIALQGRVPVKVRGTIRKGDMLISGGNGYARPCSNPSMGTVIGKALQNFSGDDGVIEVAIGRI